MRSFLFSVTPLVVALGVVGAATAAFAVQDQPFTVGDVTAVCTGVGSSKDNPEYLVESGKTGAKAAHKPSELRKA